MHYQQKGCSTLARMFPPENEARGFPQISTGEVPIPVTNNLYRGIWKAHNGFVREKSLDSVSKSASRRMDLIDKLSSPNTLAPSLDPAIFCRQRGQPDERNHNKTNILRETARKSGPKTAVNCLIHNILRVSHCSSIFCRGSCRSNHRNIKKTGILPKTARKKLIVPPGRGRQSAREILRSA